MIFSQCNQNMFDVALDKNWSHYKLVYFIAPRFLCYILGTILNAHDHFVPAMQGKVSNSLLWRKSTLLCTKGEWLNANFLKESSSMNYEMSKMWWFLLQRVTFSTEKVLLIVGNSRNDIIFKCVCFEYGYS